MFHALNSSGYHVSIKDAKRSGLYYCPACNEQVYVRGEYPKIESGHMRMHFAHYKKEERECPIRFLERQYSSNDKSEWHKNWQAKFALNQQEYWMHELKQWCRADVYLEELKRVIEFQHSSLSVEEFEKRNTFYQSKGITIIWLFDFDNFIKGNRIEEKNLNRLRENNPNWVNVLQKNNQVPYTLNFYARKFGTYKPQLNPNIQVFFSYKIGDKEYFRKLVYINDTLSTLTAGIIEDEKAFLKICRSEQIFTPVVDIENAILEDQKRLKQLDEARKTEKSVMYGYADSCRPEPSKLLDDKSETSRDIQNRIQNILNEKYLNDTFLSKATEQDIEDAWGYVKSTVFNLLKDKVDITDILDLKRPFDMCINESINKIAIEHVENNIKNFFEKDNIDDYTFDSFVEEIWSQLSDRDRKIISIDNMKELRNSRGQSLLVRFKREQAIKSSSEK